MVVAVVVMVVTVVVVVVAVIAVVIAGVAVVIDGGRAGGARAEDPGDGEAGENDGGTTEHKHSPTVSGGCVRSHSPGPPGEAQPDSPDAATNGPAAAPHGWTRRGAAVPTALRNANWRIPGGNSGCEPGNSPGAREGGERAPAGDAGHATHVTYEPA